MCVRVVFLSGRRRVEYACHEIRAGDADRLHLGRRGWRVQPAALSASERPAGLGQLLRRMGEQGRVNERPHMTPRMSPISVYQSHHACDSNLQFSTCTVLVAMATQYTPRLDTTFSCMQVLKFDL
jgi:hypothetical protein